MFCKKYLMLLFVSTFLISSCSEPVEKRREVENISLNLFFQLGIEGGGEFNDIPPRIKKKFPNVELTLYTVGGNPTIRDYPDALDKNIFPDIILDSGWLIPNYIREGFAFDHTSLAKANNLDLSQFDPALLDHIRSWGEKDQLYGIPYFSNLYALYYDKDYFDQMNVPYPKDGMTWDEVIRLSLQVGTPQMPGLVALWESLQAQFGVSFVDSKTGLANVKNHKNLADAIQLWRKIHQQSNYIYGEQYRLGYAFHRPPLRAAMYAGSYDHKQSLRGNWDMVSFPKVVGHPDWGPNHLSRVLAVSPTSEHKSMAFQVIQYMVSEEFQKENISRNLMTVLRTKAVTAHVLEGKSDKNLKALYALPFAKAPDKINQFDLTYRVFNPVFHFGHTIYPMLKNAAESEIEIEQIIADMDKGIFGTVSTAKDSYTDTQRRVREKSERSR